MFLNVVMEKINLVEILKDCPKGMELDCTMFDNVSFVGIQDSFSIIIHTPDGCKFLTPFGCYHTSCSAKCVIFPKGKTDWEGFVPPCKFKDGDICCIKIGNRKIGYYENIFIFKGINEDNYIKRYVNLHCNSLLIDDSTVCKINDVKEFRFATEEEKQKLFQAIEENGYKWNEKTKTLETLLEPTFKNGDILTTANEGIFIYKGLMYYGKNLADFYCGCNMDKTFFSKISKETHFGKVTKCRFATEEEKDKLFQVIKDNGYQWNAETKTLEKLIKPKFKVGDIIKSKNCPIAGNFVIVGIEEDNYSINLKNYCIKFKDQDNYELINKPKFKIGDRIKHKIINFTHVITGIKDEYYIMDEVSFPHGILPIEAQNEYELVPDKFDFTTLKPFDKVLVRGNNHKWKIQFFEKFDEALIFPFVCMDGKYPLCIPYSGNEHLHDTTTPCSDYYQI